MMVDYLFKHMMACLATIYSALYVVSEIYRKSEHHYKMADSLYSGQMDVPNRAQDTHRNQNLYRERKQVQVIRT